MLLLCQESLHLIALEKGFPVSLSLSTERTEACNSSCKTGHINTEACWSPATGDVVKRLWLEGSQSDLVPRHSLNRPQSCCWCYKRRLCTFCVKGFIWKLEKEYSDVCGWRDATQMGGFSIWRLKKGENRFRLGEGIIWWWSVHKERYTLMRLYLSLISRFSRT